MYQKGDRRRLRGARSGTSTTSTRTALDAAYDTQGNFSDETTVPDMWWIEGVAEYVSYSYRKVTDTEAVSEAADPPVCAEHTVAEHV